MAVVTAKPPQRLGRSHIPKEDRAVPTYRRESRVILCDADIEDFVAMRGVCLDELCELWRFEEVCGCGGRGAGRVVQPDGTVRGPG